MFKTKCCINFRIKLIICVIAALVLCVINVSTAYSIEPEYLEQQSTLITPGVSITVPASESKHSNFFKLIADADGLYSFRSTNKEFAYMYDVDGKNITLGSKELSKGDVIYYACGRYVNSSLAEMVVSVSFEEIIPLELDKTYTLNISKADEIKRFKFVPDSTSYYSFNVVSDKAVLVNGSNAFPYACQYYAETTYYPYVKFANDTTTGTITLTVKKQEIKEFTDGEICTFEIITPGEYVWFKYSYDLHAVKGMKALLGEGVVSYSSWSIGGSQEKLTLPNTRFYYGNAVENYGETQYYYHAVGFEDKTKTGKISFVIEEDYPTLILNDLGTYDININNVGDRVYYYPNVTSGLYNETLDIIISGNDNAYKAFDENIQTWYVSLNDNKTGSFKLHYRTIPNEDKTVETISLGTTYQNGYYNKIYQFTPSSSGFYRLWFNEQEMDYDGNPKEITVHNSLGDELIYINSVPDPSDMDMTGNYVYHTLYLKAGEKYIFRVKMNDTCFKLTKVSALNKGTLTIGTPAELEWTDTSASGYKFEYYSYTASDDEKILIYSKKNYAYPEILSATGKRDYIINNDSWNSPQTILNAQKGETYFVVAISEAGTIYSQKLNGADNTEVITSDFDDLESLHYYEPNTDKTWIYNGEDDTLYSDVTFSDETVLFKDNWDDNTTYLYIYDGNDNQVGKYAGEDLKGKTISLKGKTYKFRLVSKNFSEYGFKITKLVEKKDGGIPTPSITKRTIRPSDISLSTSEFAEIYYKVNTDYVNGEYTKYTGPITIDENCRVYTYSLLDGVKSDVGVYRYMIDYSPVKKPVISIYNTYNDENIVRITCEEGDIYYKNVFTNNKYVKYTTGKNISVSKGGILAAYAKVGNVKSEISYFKSNIADNGEYVYETPGIIATPVLGGYEVKVTVPDGIDLYKYYKNNNWCQGHYQYNCEDDHEMSEWSLKDEYRYIQIGIHSENAEYSSQKYYDNSKVPSQYIFTENTWIDANIDYSKSHTQGTWRKTGSDWFSYYHNPKVNNSYTVKESGQSARNVLFVEVPKADAPHVMYIASQVYISSGNGLKTYYSINDGEYIEYDRQSPLFAGIGDIIKVYSVGMGIAKSDVVEVDCELPIYNSSRIKYAIDESSTLCLDEDGVVSGEIFLTNYTIRDEDALLILAAYDKDSGRYITSSYDYVTLNVGNTAIDSIKLSGLENEDFYVSAYLWYDIQSMEPLCEGVVVYESPKPEISVVGTNPFNITITSSTEINGEVVVALYGDGDRLIEIRVFEAKENFEAPMDKVNDAKYANIFYWKDLQSMKPISDKKYISLE